MNMVFDHYPADIAPWPEGVPKVRVRAVGFPTGLVVLWDDGGAGEQAIQRREFPPGKYTVSRGGGCACGGTTLRSMKVVGPEDTIREPKTEAKTPTKRKQPVSAASE